MFFLCAKFLLASSLQLCFIYGCIVRYLPIIFKLQQFLGYFILQVIDDILCNLIKKNMFDIALMTKI